MKNAHGRRAGKWAAAAIVVAVACAPASGRGDGTPASAPVEEAAAEVIEHLVPARDSSGAAPSRFAWTPVKGADHYAIGVWDEVGRLVWRQDDLPEPSVDRPQELQLEFGTYFWSVSAIQGDRQVADSGVSAFVVVR